jgi:hypothetical protein
MEKSNKKPQIKKAVSDLGVAAFVKMHGFKCAGRKGRNFFFDMNEEDIEKFESLCIEYINSPYHDFDAQIMSLKKIPEANM